MSTDSPEGDPEVMHMTLTRTGDFDCVSGQHEQDEPIRGSHHGCTFRGGIRVAGKETTVYSSIVYPRTQTEAGEA